MKKYLILYYSKTGNSKFLSERIEEKVSNSSLRRITPKINGLLYVFLMSTLKIGVGTGVSKKHINECDEIIIVGPVWGGLLISPLKSILKKCANLGKNIHFAVTCETSDEEKNDKYGYEQVLIKAKKVGGKFVKTTEAFPTALVKNDSESWSPKLSGKTKIEVENYKGEIVLRLKEFVEEIKSL